MKGLTIRRIVAMTGVVACSAMSAVTTHAEEFGYDFISLTKDSGAPNVSITAWHADSYSTQWLYDHGTSWTNYSHGIGITNGSNDDHTVDNRDTGSNDRKIDYLALTFDQAVTLAHVEIGYFKRDSDFTVLYRDENLETANYEGWDDDITNGVFGLTRAGFRTAAHVNGRSCSTSSHCTRSYKSNYDLKNDTSGRVATTSLAASNVWLIAAYNPNLSGHKPSHIDSGDDRFKISGISVHVPTGSNGGGNGGEVPLPATAALLGLGLVLRKKVAHSGRKPL